MGETTDTRDEPREETSSRETESQTEASQSAPTTGSLVGAFVRRELATTILRPAFLYLAMFVTLVIVGLALLGGGYRTGYVAATIDLLVPLQLLIPLVAVAAGFTAIFGDERRGELALIRTYSVSPWEIVTGVYLGRALGLVLVVAAPLLLLIAVIATTSTPRLPGYAAHTGADSPVLYLRMVFLTILFALVVLAVIMAISALVRTTRAAIAGAGVTLVLLPFALDLALVFGFSLGIIGESSLATSLGFSPMSAYRGLVLETAIVSAEGTGPQTAAPLANLVSLIAWGLGSLLVAVVAVGRS